MNELQSYAPKLHPGNSNVTVQMSKAFYNPKIWT